MRLGTPTVAGVGIALLAFGWLLSASLLGAPLAVLGVVALARC